MFKITGKQIFLVGLVAFFWALCFPLIETGHRAAPPLRFGAMRSLIAGASIVIPMLLFSPRRLLGLALWKYSFFVSITYTALGFGGMFLADGRVSPGIATVLSNSQPLLAAVLAYFFLKERMSKLNISGLLLSFIGIVLIAYNRLFSLSDADSVIGISYIFMGVLGTAAGNIFMKKSAEYCDPLALTGLQLVLGSAVLYPISIMFEGFVQVNWHPSFVWSLLILAIPGTSVATVIWIYLLKKVELSALNVFTFLTPAFGLLIGYLFFQETYTPVDFSGVFLTFVGIYLATRKVVAKPCE